MFGGSEGLQTFYTGLCGGGGVGGELLLFGKCAPISTIYLVILEYFPNRCYLS